MKTHEFYHKYANTPLAEREKEITLDRYGSNIEGITLTKIYQRIKTIQDKIRPDEIELDKLLRRADDYYSSLTP